VSAWGQAWGVSWGVSWGPIGVAPVQEVVLGLQGGTSGGIGMPRMWGERPPVIRLRPSLPGSKARKLGDAEQPFGMESAAALSSRGGLGGGIGRTQRVVRPSVGVAARGLGGPAPTPGPGERPGTPGSGDVEVL
jgi:hypothetical protein